MERRREFAQKVMSGSNKEYVRNFECIESKNCRVSK
jgi:hypothetical protein